MMALIKVHVSDQKRVLLGAPNTIAGAPNILHEWTKMSCLKFKNK